ncbi:MAG TPA: HAMP domain-containing sensor histidine kinase [Longimicrobiales bacterium]|nr:HAMP domain-containing sensor histidine kinase [Longimicrobiales bacterium]
MSIVPVLVTVALLAGLVLTIRLAGERAARHAADARITALNARVAELEALTARVEGQPALPGHGAGNDAADGEWLAVFAHELRSPVGAILGYAELLEDGTVGGVNDQGRDAVLRIANAAQQILRLVEGLENTSRAGEGAELVRDIPTARLIGDAADTMRLEAEVRGVRIAVVQDDRVLRTVGDAVERALLLALGAAIKASPGRAMHISARRDQDGATIVAINGTGLAPEADDPAVATAAMTGPGLRIALARRALAPVAGTIRLQAAPDGTALLLTVPGHNSPGRRVLAAAEQDP